MKKLTLLGLLVSIMCILTSCSILDDEFDEKIRNEIRNNEIVYNDNAYTRCIEEYSGFEVTSKINKEKVGAKYISTDEEFGELTRNIKVQTYENDIDNIFLLYPTLISDELWIRKDKIPSIFEENQIINKIVFSWDDFEQITIIDESDINKVIEVLKESETRTSEDNNFPDRDPNVSTALLELHYEDFPAYNSIGVINKLSDNTWIYNIYHNPVYIPEEIVEKYLKF